MYVAFTISDGLVDQSIHFLLSLVCTITPALTHCYRVPFIRIIVPIDWSGDGHTKTAISLMKTETVPDSKNPETDLEAVILFSISSRSPYLLSPRRILILRVRLPNVQMCMCRSLRPEYHPKLRVYSCKTIQKRNIRGGIKPRMRLSLPHIPPFWLLPYVCSGVPALWARAVYVSVVCVSPAICVAYVHMP